MTVNDLHHGAAEDDMISKSAVHCRSRAFNGSLVALWDGRR